MVEENAEAKSEDVKSGSACPVYKRIVLVVTGIRGYEEVVARASELASVFNSEVVALYCLDENKVRSLARFSEDSMEAIEADLEEDGWTYLYYTEQELLERGVRVFLRFEEGSVVERVCALTEEAGADLLITQQPSESEDRTFRSYLPDIIDHISCTVMVVNT